MERLTKSDLPVETACVSPVADNPVIIPDHELEEEKKPASPNSRASAARFAAGRPGRKTNGSAIALLGLLFGWASWPAAALGFPRIGERVRVMAAPNT